MTPGKAYKKAADNPELSWDERRLLQEKACENPCYAYLFAQDVPGADIVLCQKSAAENSRFSFHFAADIPDADITPLQISACKSNEYSRRFAIVVRESDIEYCYEFSGKYKEDIEEWIVKYL